MRRNYRNGEWRCNLLRFFAEKAGEQQHPLFLAVHLGVHPNAVNRAYELADAFNALAGQD